MKISNSTPNYINQTYASQSSNTASQNAAQQKAAEEAQTDSINLSGRTKDLQKIASAIDAEPVNRQQLVADIKLQVETNQYNVNAEKVAEKLVGSLMDEIG